MANAAMLPLMGSVLTMRSAEWATVLIGACIVVPQLVVAALSPWVGHHAQIWGRRPFMLIAFASLPIRGLLFATVSDPTLLVAVQVLDGITAASLGVMVPLMVADLTRGTGRFNFAQGVVGTAMGIGASISPTLGGVLTTAIAAASRSSALPASRCSASWRSGCSCRKRGRAMRRSRLDVSPTSRSARRKRASPAHRPRTGVA